MRKSIAMLIAALAFAVIGLALDSTTASVDAANSTDCTMGFDWCD